MQHSANFGFDVPDDFPITELEAFHAAVTTHKDTHAVEWGEWAGGCNGVLYRCLQAAAADEPDHSASRSGDPRSPGNPSRRPSVAPGASGVRLT
jgi:hypothetical protein